ncbi:MAG TPA: SAM-dependent chlorinase/fluorinase [Bryobacteraceae bacterium]|jgi:S-adenosylmethionine hydrolase|nr:SAM-dependent chlorinase/fluorinase [Bryobacteraceae bacterium]
MLRGPITLTTDFGTSDHFVGTMKGVILGISPRARIVDITHEIAPQDVNEAAFVIAQAWRYFPTGSIHLVVVDPGVGSARRAILCEAEGQFFIAPDNGVLSMIYDAARHKVRVISNEKLFLKIVSKTFHGRDAFAPAAAHLSKGLAPAKFGKPIHDCVRNFLLKPTRLSRHDWSGVVLKTDRFGNLITNFRIDEFPDLAEHPMELRAGLERITKLAGTYAETTIGELFAIIGSSGYLEVAVNQGSAAKLLGIGTGSPVELEIFYE